MCKRAPLQVGLREGFRSGLEDKIADELRAMGIDPQYEQHKISYVKPSRPSRYTPDFRLPNGIFIETKGRFKSEDRQKHLLIAAQHPELDIRFVFSNSRNRISKTSKTTYRDWCDHHGFKWSDKTIPKEWIDESIR
jgi:hypothetical protein